MGEIKCDASQTIVNINRVISTQVWLHQKICGAVN
jgi:hypothetical protein